MRKKVSIIIPVYNVERYLRECLDSIATQSYPEFEAILVDDGATDTSGMICDEYVKSDPRFKVIHQSNAGSANAKNAGLEQAHGDYITFVDSDDYVEANWLECLVNALECNNADLAECDFKKEFADHAERGNDEAYIPGIYSAEEYLGFYLYNWTCSLFWNKLFKAELTKDIRFRQERRCIDDEFYTYKVISGAVKIVRIEKQLYHYRQRLSSVVSSEKNRLQITDDALEVLIERYEWVSRRFPKLRKIYLQHDVDIMFYFARSCDFCAATQSKFRCISGYYLSQSLYYFPGRITLQNALKLRINVCKNLPTLGSGQTEVERSHFFQ